MPSPRFAERMILNPEFSNPSLPKLTALTTPEISITCRDGFDSAKSRYVGCSVTSMTNRVRSSDAQMRASVICAACVKQGNSNVSNNKNLINLISQLTVHQWYFWRLIPPFGRYRDLPNAIQYPHAVKNPCLSLAIQLTTRYSPENNHEYRCTQVLRVRLSGINQNEKLFGGHRKRHR